MQPVSMIMSNINVEAMTHHAPNALAAAQDTGQSQEIVREGIRTVQRVQASEALSEMQRVHRKTENDEREGNGNGGNGGQSGSDTFVHTEAEKSEHEASDNAPIMRENIRNKKRVSFIA